MKSCNQCNTMLADDVKMCPNCGCNVATSAATQQNTKMVALVRAFMIVGCVLTSVYGFFVPICWTLPMTLTLLKKLDRNEPIGMAFKICTLLFCSTIAGILLLCMDTQPKEEIEVSSETQAKQEVNE